MAVVDPVLAVNKPSGIEIEMGAGDLWWWLAVKERELRSLRLRAAGLWGGMKLESSGRYRYLGRTSREPFYTEVSPSYRKVLNS
jgi:hypothetical protein